jgi:hypothetical protein
MLAAVNNGLSDNQPVKPGNNDVNNRILNNGFIVGKNNNHHQAAMKNGGGRAVIMVDEDEDVTNTLLNGDRDDDMSVTVTHPKTNKSAIVVNYNSGPQSGGGGTCTTLQQPTNRSPSPSISRPNPGQPDTNKGGEAGRSSGSVVSATTATQRRDKLYFYKNSTKLRTYFLILALGFLILGAAIGALTIYFSAGGSFRCNGDLGERFMYYTTSTASDV